MLDNRLNNKIVFHVLSLAVLKEKGVQDTEELLFLNENEISKEMNGFGIGM